MHSTHSEVGYHKFDDRDEEAFARDLFEALREHRTELRVAMAWGVAPNTIRYHRKRLGYVKLNGEWTKQEA